MMTTTAVSISLVGIAARFPRTIQSQDIRHECYQQGIDDVESGYREGGGSQWLMEASHFGGSCDVETLYAIGIASVEFQHLV